MPPIINPWIFYFSDVFMILKVLGILAPCLLVLVMVVLFLFKDDIFWEDEKLFSKYIKRIVISIAVSLIFAIFSPMPDTIVKMLVAQNVTSDRVEYTADTIKGIYDDIMELFEEKEDK